MKTNYKSIILAIGLFFALSVSISAAPHDLDPTFGNGGKVITNGNFPGHLEGVTDMAIQADGKIVVVGYGSLNQGRDFAVVRYNTNGSLDTSFGGNGIVITRLGDNFSGDANSVAVQADGKFVIAGGCYNDAISYCFAVVRYNPDGSLDTSFNGTGKIITPVGSQSGFASGLAIQTDGKIVVVGNGSTATGRYAFVARYNSNGSTDTSFNGTGRIVTPDCYASSAAIQTDGKIVVAGHIYDGAYFTDILATFRYNADGSPDASFGEAGRVTVPYIDIDVGNPNGSVGYGYNAAVQSDGKIVVEGQIIFDYDLGSYSVTLMIRYNPNGSPDTTFGINGIMYFPLGGNVTFQPDGKIVTVGSLFNSDNDFAVFRYNRYGSPDVTFNSEGRVFTDFGFHESAYSVAIQTDGKIIVAGSTVVSPAPDSAFALARYQGGSNARAPFDFDGDGRADLSVFRPSDRTWYLNQSANGFFATQFGLSTDKPVPADYDGDGRTDIAVYRDGIWYWLNSSDNSFNVRQFGIASDIPVPANYITGGGGRSELAVYRSGTWWILNLVNNQINTIQFGITSDKPVPADYDGDGRADIAIYRGSGEWHLNRSTQGYGVVNWGISTDKPVPADYDGDGKTDAAVYRNGTWYLRQSLQGWAEFNWGIASDTPAPADYDGDGKTDAAVYRNGIWYLRQSTSGISIQQFGLSNDKPVPAAYLP